MPEAKIAREARGAGIMWAAAKRDLLASIQRNQPAPLVKFINGYSVISGLRTKTLEAWIRVFQLAGLVRVSLLNGTDVIQLEETAESILGFKPR